MKTWKSVLPFEADGELELACPHCGTSARMPTHGRPGCLIIAAFGLNLVTDPAGRKPPPEYMPAVVQCRHCRKVYLDDTIPAALEYEASSNVR